MCIKQPGYQDRHPKCGRGDGWERHDIPKHECQPEHRGWSPVHSQGHHLGARGAAMCNNRLFRFMLRSNTKNENIKNQYLFSHGQEYGRICVS